ncbi:MAG: threonine--tRNA ligase [candidate division WS1 bacterium]|nr:threonine--tRNA ligase [candidate division WS1 bacterium]
MSDKITLTLPDGTPLEVPRGTTALEAAEKIGPRLAKAALAAGLNGDVVDLSTPINEDMKFSVYTFDSEEGKHVYWHSASHIMADAVMQLFPEARPTIGPSIEDGFYYDFEVPAPFTEDDLRAIEEKMQEIIKADQPFSCEALDKPAAEHIFEQKQNRYKLELIDEIEDDSVKVYEHGQFVDLCRGPHVPSTGRIKHVKLLSVAGAYWRGSEANIMLSRIYGTAYPSKEALEEHLHLIEEARRRDHRRLGRDLDLFSFHEEAGAGLVYYHPKGAMLRHLITEFATNEHVRRGYELVRTPHLIKSDIWMTSGHAQQGYPMYYTDIEGQSYGIKPMNCPGHILIYKQHTRSYRDLPMRYFELGTVYRHEKSGVLHGLLRVRGFTQDDAHIFCRMDQLTDEITGVLEFADDMLHVFGFDEYEVFLSTRPEKSVGSDRVWEDATEALKGALEANNLTWEVDEGGGAFYGPKIDIKMKDALGRLWQGPTIQCDFNMPERFDMTYIGEDGEEHRPAMVHRVVLAGIERFMGVFIEQCAGEFPMWVAPVQVKILPINDRNFDYAQDIAYRLRCEDLRVEVDTESGTLGNKIRQAELEKVPYMLILGDKEQEAERVAVRKRGEGDLGAISLDEFIETVRPEMEPDARYCAVPQRGQS